MSVLISLPKKSQLTAEICQEKKFQILFIQNCHKMFHRKRTSPLLPPSELGFNFFCAWEQKSEFPSPSTSKLKFRIFAIWNKIRKPTPWNSHSTSPILPPLKLWNWYFKIFRHPKQKAEFPLTPNTPIEIGIYILFPLKSNIKKPTSQRFYSTSHLPPRGNWDLLYFSLRNKS